MLAADKARYVGDHVALVVAETLAQAKAAAALVDVDYELLPAVVDTGSAAKNKTARARHRGRQRLLHVGAAATRPRPMPPSPRRRTSTTLEFVNNRLVPNAIEPRAANALYNRGDDSYTLYATSQNPHVERLLMTAFVLGLPEHKVRVDRARRRRRLRLEDLPVRGRDARWCGPRKRVGRPIKWAAERSEAFLSRRARPRPRDARPSSRLDKDGKFLALRVHTTANLGAYLSTFSSCIPTILYATLLAGQYTTPAIYCEVTGVVHQHRAGRRVSRRRTPRGDLRRRAHRRDQAARELEIDPAETAPPQLHPHVPVRHAGRR